MIILITHKHDDRRHLTYSAMSPYKGNTRHHPPRRYIYLSNTIANSLPYRHIYCVYWIVWCICVWNPRGLPTSFTGLWEAMLLYIHLFKYVTI